MSKLIESVRQWVLVHLPYDRKDADLVNHLTGLDAHALLVTYHNWMSRRIKPSPRRVLKSKAVMTNPIAAARTADIKALLDDIASGHDLTKYLSRGIKVAASLPGPSLNRRRDLDLMLIEWDIHHLHISRQLEPDGFVKRDGPVLFAMFKPATAYLIDVMNHGDWTREHVLKTIYDNWPDDGLVFAVNGVSGLARPQTDDDRAKLRKGAVNTLVDIGGIVLKPSGAISTAGTSIHATRQADQLLDSVEAFEDELINRLPQLKAKLAAQGFYCPDAPAFEFAIGADGYGVIETMSGTWIRLG